MGREETMLDHKELYPYLKQKSVEHLLGVSGTGPT